MSRLAVLMTAVLLLAGCAAPRNAPPPCADPVPISTFPVIEP